jgi:hypothetical protein
VSALPKPEKRGPKTRRPLKRTRIARSKRPRRQSTRPAAVQRRKADREWAGAVAVRAAGVCEWCEREYGTDAHHILSRRYAISRHDIRNGVFLSRECHRRAHRQPCTFGKWLQAEHPDRFAYSMWALCASIAKGAA